MYHFGVARNDFNRSQKLVGGESCGKHKATVLVTARVYGIIGHF